MYARTIDGQTTISTPPALYHDGERWWDLRDATDEQRRFLLEGLATLPPAIPEIDSYRYGTDAGLADGNATIGIVADFADQSAYEVYRERSMQDADCQAAFRYAEETGCIVSYERSFFRPVFH